MNYLVVEPNGKISGNLVTQFSREGVPGLFLVNSFQEYQDKYYDWDTEEFKVKQDMEVSISNTEIQVVTGTVTLSNIPAGTVAILDNGSYSVDDGVLEVGYNTPGTAVITLENPKYNTSMFEVVVYD